MNMTMGIQLDYTRLRNLCLRINLVAGYNSYVQATIFQIYIFTCTQTYI